MFIEINNKVRPTLISHLASLLQNDAGKFAYERSLFYVLNAVRYGGFFYRDDKFTLVFAKSYDKLNTLSLVFFNKAEVFEELLIRLLKDKQIKNQDIFIHHLFESTTERLRKEFQRSLIVDQNTAKKIKAYPSEDTYAQVIYNLSILPKFKNSNLDKIKHLTNLLRKSQGRFKQSILEYINLTTKPLNEPEEVTVVIRNKLPASVKTFISYIFKNILKNWLKAKKIEGVTVDKKYYLESIKNLFSLLTDTTLISQTESIIVFRAHFDINIEKGGLWVGEFIPSKSLLIPHIILTDHYYKNQYAYLLWDMILYGYTKNFARINVGGSEDRNLFEIKEMPGDLLNDHMSKRKLYTLYIPHQ